MNLQIFPYKLPYVNKLNGAPIGINVVLLLAIGLESIVDWEDRDLSILTIFVNCVMIHTFITLLELQQQKRPKMNCK